MERSATIITVCMGRLEHLKRSLPAMLRQKCDVIVVDYSCPEDSGAYVEQHFPQVRVVRVPGQDVFSNWKARNAGAGQATGDLLIFCDADLVLRDGAVEAIAASLPEASYGNFKDDMPKRLDKRPTRLSSNQLRGFQVVPATSFAKVGGYDELLQGYAAGGDTDLGERLRYAGLIRFHLEPETIIEDLLPHGDAERVANHRGSPGLSYAASTLYRSAKFAYVRLTEKPDVPLEMRQQMYDCARAEALKLRGQDSATITVAFREDPLLMPRLLGFESAVRQMSVKVELVGRKRLRPQRRAAASKALR